MKNYKVKAIKNFGDILENKNRTIGDEFECTKERYEFLLSKKAVELIHILETEIKPIVEKIETMDEKDIVEEPAKETKPKKKSSKKKSK